MVTISTLNLEKRIKLSNPEVMSDYYKAGKSVLLVGAHFNNWEWSLRLCDASSHLPIL